MLQGGKTSPRSRAVHHNGCCLDPFPFYGNIDQNVLVIEVAAYIYNDANDRYCNDIEEVHIHPPPRNTDNPSVRPQVTGKPNQCWGRLLTKALISHGDGLS